MTHILVPFPFWFVVISIIAAASLQIMFIGFEDRKIEPQSYALGILIGSLVGVGLLLLAQVSG